MIDTVLYRAGISEDEQKADGIPLIPGVPIKKCDFARVDYFKARSCGKLFVQFRFQFLC